jgi:hypothetical protein
MPKKKRISSFVKDWERSMREQVSTMEIVTGQVGEQAEPIAAEGRGEKKDAGRPAPASACSIIACQAGLKKTGEGAAAGRDLNAMLLSNTILAPWQMRPAGVAVGFTAPAAVGFSFGRHPG